MNIEHYFPSHLFMKYSFNLKYKFLKGKRRYIGAWLDIITCIGLLFLIDILR